ncbi:MAG: YidB family protein [Aestuariivirga sp.]
MAKRMPSLLALLGLVAVAGYQNREKIGEYVKGLSNDPNSTAGGLIESVKKTIGSSPTATSITGGLGELVDHFTKQGEGKTAESWIGKGPNAPITDSQMEKTLGPDLIDSLVKQTGLGREELLSRLSKTLPEAVDKLTPDGQVPA